MQKKDFAAVLIAMRMTTALLQTLHGTVRRSHAETVVLHGQTHRKVLRMEESMQKHVNLSRLCILRACLRTKFVEIFF